MSGCSAPTLSLGRLCRHFSGAGAGVTAPLVQKSLQGSDLWQWLPAVPCLSRQLALCWVTLQKGLDALFIAAAVTPK